MHRSPALRSLFFAFLCCFFSSRSTHPHFQFFRRPSPSIITVRAMCSRHSGAINGCYYAIVIRLKWSTHHFTPFYTFFLALFTLSCDTLFHISQFVRFLLRGISVRLVAFLFLFPIPLPLSVCPSTCPTTSPTVSRLSHLLPRLLAADDLATLTNDHSFHSQPVLHTPTATYNTRLASYTNTCTLAFSPLDTPSHPRRMNCTLVSVSRVLFRLRVLVWQKSRVAGAVALCIPGFDPDRFELSRRIPRSVSSFRTAVSYKAAPVSLFLARSLDALYKCLRLPS